MKDVYQEITNKFIEELEKGNIPWQKPWTPGKNLRGCISYSTGKRYSYLNQIWLAIQEKSTTIPTTEYATFAQIKAAGGKVKKGSKAKFVAFYKLVEIELKDENGTPILDDDGNPEKKTIPVIKEYQVFNIETDVEGLEFKHIKETEFEDKEPVDEAEALLREYTGREGIKLYNDQSDSAYYSPSADEIHLPSLNQFKLVEEYYSAAFHEATHSTGHENRLNRFGEAGPHSFGSENYSKEELVAEIGSAYILSELGIDTASSFKNSAAYLQSWLSALKNDKKLIVSASAKAEKAVEFITAK